MIQRVETLSDITLNKPVCSVPDIDHLTQRGVATPAGPEPMRTVGELHVVIRVEKHAYHLGEQLVRKGRQPQRASLPISFRDVNAFYGRPTPLFGPNDRDDTPDLVQGHTIHGVTGDPSGHRTRIGIQP